MDITSRLSRARNSRTSSDIQRRHRPDYQIVLFMGLLMLLGLIVIYAIGPQRANVLNNAFGTDYADSYFFVKQTISLLLACGAFVACALLPFSFMKSHGRRLVWIGLGACALLALFGLLHVNQIAQCTYGACRWFTLGPLGSIQPAEFVKFAMLLFTAGFLGKRVQEKRVNDVHATLIPLGIMIGLAMFFIIVLQKDMGTGIALVAILASMLTVAGLGKKIGFMILGGAVLLGVLLIVIAPHRIDRVATFLGGDSTSDSSDDSSYHITHAKIAIGSGGLTGVGIGNSVQATGYLPESINDSVFAIMGETFGYVGLIVILALFTALLFRLLKVADHLIDPSMRLAVAGVFGWLAAHVTLNVAAMIGVFPLTGITLPLLSFGGTSMIFIAGALGLAFQLSRYTVHRSHVSEKETNHENSRGRRGLGRTRYASISGR